MTPAVRHTLRKKDVLRGRKSFDLLFRRGEKFSGTAIRCLVVRTPADVREETPRVIVGFAVPKTVKRAVDRNRIKRFLRESYRLNTHLLAQQKQLARGVTILFLYSHKKGSPAGLPSYHDVEQDMKQLLKSVSGTLSA